MKNNSPIDSVTLLEKLNNAIASTIYIFDMNEGLLSWINKYGEETYGYSLEEIRKLGQEYHIRTVHPDDLVRLADLQERVKKLKDGEALTLEYRLRDRKGNIHWVSDRITVSARNEKGEAIAFLGVASEINERKAHEEKLQRSIDKLNFSLSAANMGMWEWNVDTKVTVWDDRMYEIHGMTRDQDITPTLMRCMDPNDLEMNRIKIQDSVASGKDLYLSYRIRLKNNEIHHIRVYGKLHNHSIMYGVGWDSTEEVLTEQQISEARAKLMSATKMAALGEMSGGIAHEINNPLTVIQARSFQLMQMVDANKLDSTKVRQAADSISRTADKIARIIKSLRSFAREGTQDPFELAPIRQIIEETLEFCRQRFYNHGIEIELVDIDPDLEIECRLVQIEQVLLNLLNNSFDAIQNLEEKWIKISVKEFDDNIEIYIADSGHGIDPKIAEQIMMPFFTTKEVGKGTGLGLSISAGILRSHGGNLILKKDEKHTTFVMQLPKWQNQSY